MLIISNERNKAGEEDGMDCQVEMGVAVAMCFLLSPHFSACCPTPAFLFIFVMQSYLATSLFSLSSSKPCPIVGASYFITKAA